LSTKQAPGPSRSLRRFTATAGVLGIAAAGIAAGASSASAATTEAHLAPRVADVEVPPGRSPGGAAPLATGWAFPNADQSGTRDVASRVDRASANRLGLAWEVPLPPGGTDSDGHNVGNYATSPVVVDGVAYEQNLMSDVQAVDFRTGRVLWTHVFNFPNGGPDGVNVQAGVVYGATGDSAFALDARTGATLWIRRLTRNANEGIDMAPGVNDGTVYVSTVPVNAFHFYAGNGQSILTAMDARTGAVKWQFREVGDDLFGNPMLNGGGGQWQSPTFDAQGNLYIEVGNPIPFVGSNVLVPTTSPQDAYGGSRPGPNLYTDSVVKLDAATGRMDWYYQLTPHDVYDHDLNNQAILMNAGGREIVVSVGKAGIAIANDAQTGALLWRTPVGVHNGHDDDNLLAEDRDLSQLPDPSSSFDVLPGELGGAETPPATDGRLVFIPIVNLAGPVIAQVLSLDINPAEGTGEMVAVDAATGRIVWDHQFAQSLYGGATVSNGLVWTTTFDGRLVALDTSTGAVAFQRTLPSFTNAPVVIDDDTVLTASTLATSSAQSTAILAYRIGASGPPAGSATPGSPIPVPMQPGQRLPQGFHLMGIHP